MKFALLILMATVLSVATNAGALEDLRAAARENAGRYNQISNTIRRDAPAGDTNVCYECRSSYQQRLDSARNLASVTISSNSYLRVINAQLYTMATNFYAKSILFSNACVIAQGLYQSAQGKIETQIAALETNLAKYKELQTKYPALDKLLWSKLISDTEEQIARLQALTGEAK